MDEETIAKRNLMYDAAIKFMEEPPNSAHLHH